MTTGPHRPAEIVLIAARARNGVIGDRGRIPWHLPGDFAHFKKVTLGHPLLLGRTTFESIGRVLPGREHIVLTRDRGWSHAGVRVVHDLDRALTLAADLDDVVHVAGGAQVYAATLGLATEQVLTEVDLAPAGETHYPDFDEAAWSETAREEHPEDTPAWTVRRLRRA